VLNQARSEVADILGCRPEQIIFTSGGSEANNTVIKGVSLLRGKGHIITSKIEHESVLGACRQMEKQGIEVTYLAADDNGKIRSSDVKRAIRSETILISIMHANNETGILQPVREIAKIARERNIPFHTDAVQSFGKIEVKVDDIGCEFLSITAHKINGPKECGALFFRGTAKFDPLIFGGSQERELRAGTEGIHQIAGFGTAARLAGGKMKREFQRLSELRKTLVDGLKEKIPDVIINEAAPSDQMPGTISATFPGRDGLRLLAGLDCYEIAVSIGSACTADRIEPSHVLLGMGKGETYALSTIRISMGCDTRGKHIGYFLWALGKVLAGDPEGFEYLDPQHLTEERILSEKTFLIDLRFPYERMLSPSIPSAKFWSHIGIEKYLNVIPKDKEVVLMCSTGIFSFSAGYRLARKGHKSVKVVYGGYNAWRSLYPDMIKKLQS
jgi:cysteine desulfurase